MKIILLLLLLCSKAFADPAPHYEDTWVQTTLVEDENGITLDLPFKIYAQTIYLSGQDVTMSLDKSMAGSTVDAWVCYDRLDYEIVSKFKGYDGKDALKYDSYQKLPLYPTLTEKESAHELRYDSIADVVSKDEITIGVKNDSFTQKRR